jgi:diguanylate cyclase (GGDEF)-like protein
MVSSSPVADTTNPLSSPLFAGAPRALVQALVCGCETRELRTGEYLLTAGTENDELFVVLDGALSVRLPETAHPIVPVGPGECVGELSLLDGCQVSADVLAAAPTLVIAIEREHLWMLMEQAPVVARNLLRLLAGRVRNDNRLLQDAERRQSQYERAATIDGLTGLRNRRWLDDAFSRQLQRSSSAGQPVSVLMCDADRFKVINDTYGHLVGDQVLVHLGQTLAGGLRSVDLLARYGGEEFAAMLPGVALETALAVAERLRRAVEHNQPVTTADSLGVTTVSIGVATTCAERPMTLQALLDAADQALFRAKQQGRNCVTG